MQPRGFCQIAVPSVVLSEISPSQPIEGASARVHINLQEALIQTLNLNTRKLVSKVWVPPQDPRNPKDPQPTCRSMALTHGG